MKATFEVSLPKPAYNETSHDAAREQAEKELANLAGFAFHDYTMTLTYQEADTDLPDEGSHYWLVTLS